MKVFKITALALATSLILAGCGGDGSTSEKATSGSQIGGNHSGGSETSKLSELDQGKELIRTAKLFVSDNKAVTEAYEGASDVLTGKQSARVAAAFDVPADLNDYMRDNSLTKIDANELKRLSKQQDFQENFYNLQLEPGQNFVAMLASNGKFTLAGDVMVTTYNTDYQYNSQTKRYDEVIITNDTFKVNYSGFEDALQNNETTSTPRISFGFDKITMGTGSDKVVISSTKKGIQAYGMFSDKVTSDYDFDIEDAHAKGITIQKAEATLDNIKLVANDSVLIAKDFAVAVLDISQTSKDGHKNIRTLPYKIAFTGHLTKDTPKTDIEITFNTTANDSDVKKYIELTGADKFVEKEGKYVGMTTMLSLKGDVTKHNASGKDTVIPLDFLAQLKRTARDVITLENLTASVEGKALYVEGKANLDTDYNSTKTQFIVKQNDARVVLNVDADGEFKTNDQGKLSDIMVNGKDYGDLIENKGKVTAKFKDNSIIVL